MKRIAALFLLALQLSFLTSAGIALLWGGPSTFAQQRTFNSPNYPWRKLAKQFNGSSESFTTTNPDPDGTPLTITSATGVIGPNGTVTMALQDGFTAPVTLTVFFWNADAATWNRLAPSATGADQYSVAVDSHYALVQFSGPEGTPFLVMSSAAITGFVYTDAKAHPRNNNTAS